MRLRKQLAVFIASLALLLVVVGYLVSRVFLGAPLTVSLAAGSPVVRHRVFAQSPQRLPSPCGRSDTELVVSLGTYLVPSDLCVLICVDKPANSSAVFDCRSATWSSRHVLIWEGDSHLNRLVADCSADDSVALDFCRLPFVLETWQRRQAPAPPNNTYATDS